MKYDNHPPLPAGPYICDVMNAEPWESRTGNQVIRCVARVVKTDRDITWWITDAHMDWKEFADDFNNVPAAIVGRRFLFKVTQIPHGGERHNAAYFPLAEVVA